MTAADPLIAQRVQQLDDVLAALERRVAALEATRWRVQDAPAGSVDAASSVRSGAPQPASGSRQTCREGHLDGAGEAPAGQTRTNGETEKQLRQELEKLGVDTARFVRVPADYYDRPLEYRQQCLGADSVRQLCKSIILENTKAPPDAPDSDPTARLSRYYCVIVQYAARLHTEKLKRYLHKLNGELGIKNFNMRLAPAPVSDRLTGYEHNAVTPICMETRLPIVLSHCIAELDPPFFWLGAGETDLKVGMSVPQFVSAYKPLVVDCSYEEPLAVNENCLST